jgi:hypothetical protein
MRDWNRRECAAGVRAYRGRVHQEVEQRGVCNRVVKREKGVDLRGVFNTYLGILGE